ncbi:MAG: hypothetical protein QHH27_01555 [Clostridia bacterium]|jgi:hypothetical protein|nr:hypothetical protein [Clostridia bacterium]MDH7572224.1 hypothetical protein [Clostridia bacterium]
MTPEEYLVVEARIKKEAENLERLEKELERLGLFPEVRASKVGGFALSDSAACRIVGSILHDYYVAVENIFKVVATRLDKSILAGEQWHRELLEQMTLEVQGVRPALLSPEAAAGLDRLRAFRHVFRNVYGFNLSPEKIKELLLELPRTSALLKRDLSRFAGRIRESLLR